MNNNNLRKSFKLWMGIIIAITVYYVIHEGTHFIQAILTNNFDSIRIIGLAGIEIGGDMNGITNGLGISSLPVSISFGILAIMNIYIIIKKVHPAYKRNFL